MRYFYEMYPDAVICPQVEDELITDANRPQVVDDLQIIFRIPWGHNKIILDKCKGNSAKALFYIRKTIENNWNTEKFIDMLFYNTQRHCYVVVEIKTGKFDSSYAGQLGTYVVAVNHQMKTEADNPTLGLLICKDMDKVEAQYALESTSQPLGISSYELSKLIPEEFKGSMPTIEEIEAELNE